MNSLDNGNEEAAAGKGKVEFNKGNFDNAAKLFRESGKGEELASYFNTLAISKVSRGKFDEGIQVYSNAKKVLPDNTKFHLLEFNIGLAYRKSGRFGEAANAFARSVVENPAYEKAALGLMSSLEEAKKKNQTYEESLVKKAIEKISASKGEAQKAG